MWSISYFIEHQNYYDGEILKFFLEPLVVANLDPIQQSFSWKLNSTKHMAAPAAIRTLEDRWLDTKHWCNRSWNVSWRFPVNNTHFFPLLRFAIVEFSFYEQTRLAIIWSVVCAKSKRTVRFFDFEFFLVNRRRTQTTRLKIAVEFNRIDYVRHYSNNVN